MENQLLKSALWYARQGFSVIPVKQDKKPFVKWEPFQSERASQDQIHTWWKKHPGANIGLVCGEVSGIDVVDCDSEHGRDALNEFLSDSFITPVSKTPKGWHYFFKHSPGLSNGVKVITDCDLRTTGGYAIAPPSKNGKGKSYAWMQKLSIAKVDPEPMPEMLFDILQPGGAGIASPIKHLKNNIINTNVFSSTRGGSTETDGLKLPQVTTSDHSLFSEGSRDETLFHIANCLVKGGMQKAILSKVLNFFASHCKPPFPQKK